MKTFTVKRLLFDDKCTIGELWLDGKKLCDTLEPIYREPGEPKVEHKTAIPYGHYRLIVSFSNRFQMYMPEVLDIPGFSAVRLHFGNSAENSSGCCLLGIYSNTTKDWISHSRDTVAKVFAIINKIDKKEKMLIDYIKG